MIKMALLETALCNIHTDATKPLANGGTGKRDFTTGLKRL
jgi:hypothetical protein